MKPIELIHGLSIAPLKIELLRVESHRDDSRSLFGPAPTILTFTWRMLERNTHEPILLEISESVDDEFLAHAPPDWLALRIRKILCETMCHEVDELLRMNGKRIRDPHA